MPRPIAQSDLPTMVVNFGILGLGKTKTGEYKVLWGMFRSILSGLKRIRWKRMHLEDCPIQSDSKIGDWCNVMMPGCWVITTPKQYHRIASSTKVHLRTNRSPCKARARTHAHTHTHRQTHSFSLSLSLSLSHRRLTEKGLAGKIIV